MVKSRTEIFQESTGDKSREEAQNKLGLWGGQWRRTSICSARNRPCLTCNSLATQIRIVMLGRASSVCFRNQDKTNTRNSSEPKWYSSSCVGTQARAGKSTSYRRIHDYMTHLIATDIYFPCMMHTAFLLTDHVFCLPACWLSLYLLNIYAAFISALRTITILLTTLSFKSYSCL